MAELNFDIVILDCGKNPPYTPKTLESQALGGVEATVIRVAEALGGFPLPNGKTPLVAVVKCSNPDEGIEVAPFEPYMGQYAYFMHEKELHRMDAKYLVCLRGPLGLGLFPKARNFVWCHDLATPDISNWLPLLKQHDATVIAVSRWHRDNIKKHLDYDRVTYVYNPVDDKLYLPPGKARPRVNRDLMVWASSPHKGLDKALGVYKRVHEALPNLRLLVYNPGYIKGHVIINPGVLYYGPTACKHVHFNIRNSLCLFYPSEFQETFGLVAAEANALGTPVIGYRTGALPEVVSNPGQLVDLNDEDSVCTTIETWYKNGPPVTHGYDAFRLSIVAGNWLRILAGKV